MLQQQVTWGVVVKTREQVFNSVAIAQMAEGSLAQIQQMLVAHVLSDVREALRTGGGLWDFGLATWFDPRRQTKPSYEDSGAVPTILNMSHVEVINVWVEPATDAAPPEAPASGDAG